jgi:transcriptional regulator with PAS, ATPase and Fis domain
MPHKKSRSGVNRESEFQKLRDLGEEVVHALIDNPYECPIVIDRKGIIRFMGRFSKDLIRIDPNEAVGKHISAVIPETHLHEILEDGKARIGDTLYIAGRQQIISRIPLRDLDDNLIGAVGKGMFNEASKVIELHHRIEQLNGELQYLQKQVNIMKGGVEIVGQSVPIQTIKKTPCRRPGPTPPF